MINIGTSNLMPLSSISIVFATISMVQSFAALLVFVCVAITISMPIHSTPMMPKSTRMPYPVKARNQRILATMLSSNLFYTATAAYPASVCQRKDIRYRTTNAAGFARRIPLIGFGKSSQHINEGKF